MEFINNKMPIGEDFMWKEYLSGKTIGQLGSEDGVILKDEEYNNSCRLTLEKCKGYFAITCGIYGSMVHTSFAMEDDYQSKYDLMKKDLQEFLCKITTGGRKRKLFEEFTRKY